MKPSSPSSDGSKSTSKLPARTPQWNDIYLVEKLVHATDDKETGKLARAARLAAGLKICDVALSLQLSSTHVSDLEHGRRRWNHHLVQWFREVLCQPIEP